MIRAALAALLLGAAAPVAAQTIAITGGMVATGDGSEPVSGTVVIRNGRIVAAGPGVRVPVGATIVDASGKWVTPGIVAGFSRLGLSEVDLSAEGTDDRSANGPFSAAIDVAPAINPLASTIAVNRADGVTRAIVAPESSRNIFAGQGAVIDTGADMDPITAARRFQFVELGETGADKAGGSRASAHVLFRNALREAAELRRFAQPIASSGDREPDERDRPVIRDPNESRIIGPDARRSQDVLLTRFDAAALVPVLQGRQYLLVHAERASDILQVIRLRREFPSLKLVLVGASEGWTVADRIAAAGIPVIASPVNDLPSSFEQLAATQSNVGRMRQAGVNVSIGMIDDDDARNIFYERQYAGNLVALRNVPGATGVSWGEALAMITSRPAEALGMGREIGSLLAGRRADVVIWSGDPLEGASAAETVFIDGVQQPLVTHQTRLRDRYRYLPRRDLPEAYRH
ncbi:amidohydrolase family protein [Sphingomonas sp.]|uniref:amidohydrolase family protein n=1 Tax=Sphingomonas sp. TaxID=28214 RepID=UPI0018006EF8|nr:amidohydrolase family protein [Sphingomonas sp.]MBA3511475.1 amidohydrolase family protein [Sphingomonas sp.]